jgi:transaldolase
VQSEQQALREQLLFKTSQDLFVRECDATRSRLAADYLQASSQRRHEITEALTELTIDLQSYLLRWHLQSPESRVRVDTIDVRTQADRNYDLLRRWGADDKVRYAKAEVVAIEASNLRRLSVMTDRGEVNNRWGNDAATGLTRAIRRGAVLVTTNPVMVNAVRKEDPLTWVAVRDRLKRDYPGASAEQRASLMTMSVVLENCRELRPIYEATGGKYGYVSLQINPRSNTDAARMSEEVEDLYARLTVELDGPPNTMFKIPGTKAGLEAVRRLTSKGIGVTVTVNCSLAQHLAFGEVIERGSAELSFLVMMMGRLDDPIREELRELDPPEALDVARWASIGVLRESYRALYHERRYTRSAILAASLRGPWNIDGSIVDGDAPLFITCFPDKAAEYDANPREIVSHIHEPLPPGVVATLARSRIFRQAYDPVGLTIDEFDSFPPVTATLNQFAKNYDEFLEFNR